MHDGPTATPTTSVQGAAEELRRLVLLIQSTIDDAAEVAHVLVRIVEETRAPGIERFHHAIATEAKGIENALTGKSGDAFDAEVILQDAENLLDLATARAGDDA